MNDLLIKGNGEDFYRNGYDYYHVRMGKGFIDAIEGGAPRKDPVENATRLEDGVRIIASKKLDKRTVTLAFNIHGATKSEYMANKEAFVSMLQYGMVSIKVNDTDHPKYYHLLYTGKSVTYHHSYNGKFGVWTAQFTEPNPADNSETGENLHFYVI